eukprot:s7_g55.t2
MAVPLWMVFLCGVFCGLCASHLSKWRRSSKVQRKKRQYVPRGSGGGQIRDSVAGNVRREVLCQDAIPWLQSLSQLPAGSCVLTGVPDIHELENVTLEGYIDWFQMVVKLILEKLPEQSRAIFMQTDVKVSIAAYRGSHGTAVPPAASCGGQVTKGSHGQKASGSYWQWLDKAHIAILAASQVPGVRLLWHRIIFSGQLTGGGRSGFSAGYTHYFCFSNDDCDESLDRGFPDVIRKGVSTWTSGAGVNAVELACSYLKSCGCRIVVDPFCGEGAVLAVANALQLEALGVEQSQKRARQARTLDGEALLKADREAV